MRIAVTASDKSDRKLGAATVAAYGEVRYHSRSPEFTLMSTSCPVAVSCRQEPIRVAGTASGTRFEREQFILIAVSQDTIVKPLGQRPALSLHVAQPRPAIVCARREAKRATRLRERYLVRQLALE